MDKLTNLIKEARPLYKSRKRKKAIAKLASVLCIPVFFFMTAHHVYIEGNNVYMAMSQDDYIAQFLDVEYDLLKAK